MRAAARWWVFRNSFPAVWRAPSRMVRSRTQLRGPLPAQAIAAGNLVFFAKSFIALQDLFARLDRFDGHLCSMRDLKLSIKRISVSLLLRSVFETGLDLHCGVADRRPVRFGHLAMSWIKRLKLAPSPFHLATAAFSRPKVELDAINGVVRGAQVARRVTTGTAEAS